MRACSLTSPRVGSQACERQKEKEEEEEHRRYTQPALLYHERMNSQTESMRDKKEE